MSSVTYSPKSSPQKTVTASTFASPKKSQDVHSHILTKKLTAEDLNGIYIWFSKEISQFQRTSGHKTLAKTIISLEKY
jgi:hypothetical protein